jgi:uncharacterized membrane protein
VKNSSKIVLAILIIFAALLRIYQIGFQCIWTEEAYTLSMAKLSFVQILTTFDFNPPVYYIFAHISYLLFGTDIAIRYPSAICGILVIPAMYWLGKEYKDELAGLYCAGFATITFPLIYYAQYARAYEMSVLCFIILLISYIKVKRGEWQYKKWFWIISIINVWVHLFAIIPVGLLCLDILFDERDTIYAILTAVAISPLLNTICAVIANRSVASGVSYGATAIQMIVLTPMEFFNVLFVNIFFLAGVGIWMDKDPLRNRLVAVTIITLIVGVICSCFTPFFPRYYMTVSMIILLFAAVACVELSKYIHTLPPIVIFILLMIVFTIMMKDNFISHYTITQYTCGG